MFQKLLDAFDRDGPSRVQALFCNIFIQENRLQTACEKLQTDITMKQWLLLAMLEVCPGPPTLTNVGALMGCSRQNVKKLAQALAEKGYLELSQGPGRALYLTATEKVSQYGRQLGPRRQRLLELLYADFSQEELSQLYALNRKLYAGLNRAEAYAAALPKGEEP